MELSRDQQVEELNRAYEENLAKIKSGQDSEAQSPQHEADHIVAEHEAFSETTEKMIQQEVPEFKASSHQPGHSVDELSEQTRAKIQELVTMAGDNPYKSVQEAKNLNDPTIFDALHGALTNDANFMELVKQKKLEQLAA